MKTSLSPADKQKVINVIIGEIKNMRFQVRGGIEYAAELLDQCMRDVNRPVADKVERDHVGRWITPPKSPGRPVGPSRAERVAGYVEPHIQRVLDKAIDLAVQGDPASMKLVLERFSPLARADDERVLVPGFAGAPTLEGKSAAVMAAIASGEVSAAAGQRLLQALETHVRVVTAGNVEERLAALERGQPRPITVDDATGTVIDNSDLA